MENNTGIIFALTILQHYITIVNKGENMTKTLTEQKYADQKLDAAQSDYYKARNNQATNILKDLASMQSINKFEIEKLIERANSYLNPIITKSNEF